MKTVIEMARDAGGRAQQNKNCDVEYLMDAEALKRFAELVRADEREQCLHAAEVAASLLNDPIAAIRARSNT